MSKRVPQEDDVIIRFAGDPDDTMPVAGDRYTQETEAFGNDLPTPPNFSAEIRAPAGALPGVSSFQLHFADHDILTPGDAPDVLVAMNPAALKANLDDLPRGGDIIANTDEFTKRNLSRVGYETSPLEDGSLDGYNLHAVPIASMTVKALEEFDITRKDAERAKNMFALGLLSWLYNRSVESTIAFLEAKFAGKPDIMKANKAAFHAGWNYGETTESFSVQCEIRPAPLAPGTYRTITGNSALAIGLVAASRRSGLSLFVGTFPITPASDILHELAKLQRFGVRTFQAEDEIGGVGAALGASFGGALGVTTTSGPGMVLAAETIGLAISLELPLIVCDIQRAGPSTGMPSRTEQADLLMALFGRNGESPVAVLAAATPSDCFDIALEAVRIAVKYRTPVTILSDVCLAKGSEPWRIPDVAALPKLRDELSFANPGEWLDTKGKTGFRPYQRDPETLARPWAIPGTPGLEHRIGGIEKADGAGTISYDPDNHDRMVRLRQAKIDGIAADIPPLEVDDPDGDAKVLVLGWGSTFGSIGAAVRRVRRGGSPVAQAHLRHLSPFPANLGDVLAAYDKVLVPEINLGQLTLLLRGRYLTDVISYSRVRGLPFRATELAGAIQDVIANAESGGTSSRRVSRRPGQPQSGGQESSRSRGEEGPAGGGGWAPVTGVGASPDRRRYLKGECPESIPVGEPFSLLASIVLAGPASASLKLFDVPSHGRDVLLVVHAPRLRLLGRQRMTIHVPTDADSERVMFELCADSPGSRSVSITAWLGGSYLGELRVEITAERGRPSSQHRDVIAEIATEPTDGAVSLVVRYDPVQNAYRFEFRDDDNPEEVTSHLAYEPGPQVERLVAELDELAAGNSGYSAAQARDYLINSGAALWRELVPQRLREQFWDRQDRIRQLTILSDKDAIPWELLYPLDSAHDAGFLVEQFPVMRAVFGHRPPRRLSLQPARFVLPENSPPEALKEIEVLRRLIDPGQPPEELISALTPLQELIRSGDFGLLHFACHNRFDSTGGSSITLDQRQFSPTLMTTAVIGQVLAPSAPTIFLNACRSAGLAARYNQLDGWANKFLEAGAGVFIGSLWAVSDEAAREFAEELYRQLHAGSPLGEAVMHARRIAARQPGDPSWLAYTVYGDPRAKISTD